MPLFQRTWAEVRAQVEEQGSSAVKLGKASPQSHWLPPELLLRGKYTLRQTRLIFQAERTEACSRVKE